MIETGKVETDCQRMCYTCMRQKLVNELESEKGMKNVFRIVKQVAKLGDLVGRNCVKDSVGKM